MILMNVKKMLQCPLVNMEVLVLTLREASAVTVLLDILDQDVKLISMNACQILASTKAHVWMMWRTGDVFVCQDTVVLAVKKR